MATKLIPVLDNVSQVGPMKLPLGFAWGVTFILPTGVPKGGHILQEVHIVLGGTSQVMYHYMEAWSVNYADAVSGDLWSLGQVLPSSNADPRFHRPCNDFFFKLFPRASTGLMIYQAVAAFYDEPLTGFARNNTATLAGGLAARTVDQRRPAPKFWDGTGLFRMLRFEFDFRRATTPEHASLKTVTLAHGKLGIRPTESQWTTWTDSVPLSQ